MLFRGQFSTCNRLSRQSAKHVPASWAIPQYTVRGVFTPQYTVGVIFLAVRADLRKAWVHGVNRNILGVRFFQALGTRKYIRRRTKVNDTRC